MPPTAAPRETRSLDEALQFPGSIKALDLSGNDALEELPESIGQLGGLEVLDVSHTSLGKLPRALFKLASLRVLRPGFTKLRRLRELGVSSWAMKVLTT